MSETIFINEDNLPFRPSNIFNSEYDLNSSVMKYYNENIKNAENLSKILKTDLQNGLNSNDLNWRKEKYGDNSIFYEEDNFKQLFFQNLKEQTMKFFLIISIIYLLFTLYYNETYYLSIGEAFFSILFILFINIISSLQIYCQRKRFTKIDKIINKKEVIVIRNKIKVKILEDDLLVGDILLFKAGDIINEDGIAFDDTNAEIDESNIINDKKYCLKNSEFKFINHKIISTPIIFSGSKVIKGYGKMIVCTVGDNTFQEINKYNVYKIKDVVKDTFKNKVENFSDHYTDKQYLICIFYIIFRFLKELYFKYINNNITFSGIIELILHCGIVFYTLFILLVPENLEKAISNCISCIIIKMNNSFLLMRDINKFQIVPYITDICMGLTNIILRYQCNIVNIFIGEKDYNLKNENINNEDIKNIIQDGIRKTININYNTNDKYNDINLIDKEIISYYKKFYNDNDRLINEEIKYIFPFDSEFKFSINIYECKDGNYKLYIKGAPEILFEYTLNYQNGKDEIKEFNKELFLKKQKKYTSISLRTIYFGYKNITKDEILKSIEKFPNQNIDFYLNLINNLTFLFMIAINQELRAEAKESINICKNTGINIHILTGENKNTALSICQNLDLIELNEISKGEKLEKLYEEYIKNNNDDLSKITEIESPIILDGKIFRKISGGIKFENNNYLLKNEKAFNHIIQNLKIISRVNELDKLILITGLKNQNKIVSYIGKNQYDSSSLLLSHYGISLGIKGCDITKYDSDIFILDDSFSTFITLINFGRNFYFAVKNFIEFQFISCVVINIFILFGGFLFNDFPFNPTKNFWFSIVIDFISTFAFYFGKFDNYNLLEDKPISLNDRVINIKDYFRIGLQILFEILILMFILLFGDFFFNVKSDVNLSYLNWNNENGYHLTIIFNVYFFMLWFNLYYNCSIIGINKINLSILIVIFLIQILFVTFGGSILRTKSLNLNQHLICILIGFLIFVFKSFFGLREKKKKKKDNMLYN